MGRAGSSCPVRALVLAVLACGAAQAGTSPDYPPESEVPAPGTALIMVDRFPDARMRAGGAACELIAGVLGDGMVRPEGGLLLYRQGRTTPFMGAKARDDGLVVAHFRARPDELIEGRAYHSVQGGTFQYGEKAGVIRRSGKVRLGDVEPVGSPAP